MTPAFPTKVYVDLDGVLADFEAHYVRVMNRSFPRKFTEELWYDLLERHPNFFRDIPLNKNASILLEALPKEKTEILTAIPSLILWPNCTTQKRDWVREHLGADIKVNFGPYSMDKRYHASPGDILIDDSEQNIVQWKSHRGYGIRHISVNRTVEEFRLLTRVLGSPSLNP